MQSIIPSGLITFYILTITSSTHQSLASYEWQTGRWGSCSSPSSCGEGIRERTIECVLMEGDILIPESNCNSSKKPASVEKCFHVCDKLKPYLWWSVDSWSSCVPHKDKTIACSSSGSSNRRAQCQYRNKNGIRTVPDDACDRFWTKPEESMTCSYECPQDCVTSSRKCYNNSSSCSPEERRTRIIVAPESGGIQCPEENSTDCQNAECLPDDYSNNNNAEYILKIGDWGPCMKTNYSNDITDSLTGLSLIPEVGLTQRKIICLNSVGESVNLSYCSHFSESIQQQRCLIPKDCELSPWSEWRIIKEGCINSQEVVNSEIRERTRELVRPALGNGVPCGPLYEKRIVISGLLPCTKYQWYSLEWSECVIFNHRDLSTVEKVHPVCGGGVQERQIICLRVADSLPVSNTLCADPKPSAIQRCEIPCIRDCQVSEWSRWGPCLPFDAVTDFNKLLSAGYQKRSRSIVISPSPEGLPCPHLDESDMCTEVAVAKWLYGNWSECRLLDRSSRCGPGEKTRDFSCVTYKGNPISEIFCEKHASIRKTTESCRLPCPDDCTLSNWSEWTRCPSDRCSDKDVEGNRIHRNRTVLAIKGKDGSNCHDDRKESKLCNRHSCSLVRWMSSSWSECQTEGLCGEGRQVRDIFCRKGESLLKDDADCRNLEKPINIRSCYKDCPEDCLVTNFTKWTDCPDDCSAGAKRMRTRYIQRISKHGGTFCPEILKEVSPCPTENDVECTFRGKSSYHWMEGPWSSCILPDTKNNCGTGFQIRNISCVDDTSEIAEMHKCLNTTEMHVHQLSAVPLAFRLCHVTCQGSQPSCVHSAWTSWSSCPHKYKAKRMRTRELVGSSSSNPFCIDRFTLTEQENCPFLKEELSPSIQTSWSSCILDENSNRTSVAVNGEKVFHYCGAGYRYKTGLQVKEVDVIEPGIERDLCLIDCPVDCLMSDWSDWTSCDVPCGQGYTHRYRKILVPSNSLGRPCPSSNTTETKVCEVSCNDYIWHTYGWGKCILMSRDRIHKTCGNGTRQRTVECIEKISGNKEEDSKCDPLIRPRDFDDCTISCPGECVVSEWNTWKPCVQPCRSENLLQRRRTIFRTPDPPLRCPTLLHNESCILNENCFEFTWIIGDWTSCVLPPGARCGEGIRRRALQCQRSDGRQVDNTNCKKISESPSLKNILSEPCYQDCPIDCVVSNWSGWNESQCMQNCGTTGMMIRHRAVVQPASESGQPCTAELEQEKPCSFKPCYHWKNFDWSPCDLQSARCGYGVRRRLVGCVRYDDLPVDKIHCLASNLTFQSRGWLDPKWLILAHDKAEEEDCYVRCPGDCILSEWTQWSHCHKDCDMGQTIGYQTSSRTLILPSSASKSECPINMWRTRPCWDNRCAQFKWKFKNGTLTCEDADGAIVTGGCSKVPRPCFKGCEQLPGGKCNSRWGTCFCRSGTGRLMPVPNSLAGRRKCYFRPPQNVGPKRPANHTAPTQEIHLKYYPDDSQVSFWMYAMISTGSAFVIFVAVTIYLMCSNGNST